MEKTEWTKDIATGIKEIDEQHKVFIGACAVLITCVDKCLSQIKVKARISGLEKIAKEHFLTEESMMAGTYYPDTKGHIKLHGHFYEELKTVKSRVEAGENGADFAAEIKEKLADWFIIHIRKNDLKLAKFIKEMKKGV